MTDVEMPTLPVTQPQELGLTQPQNSMGNPIENLQRLAATQNAMNQNALFQQQFQARRALGPMYQQSIDPQTGQVDLNKLGTLVGSNPTTAFMAPQIMNEAIQRQYTQTQTQLAKFDMASKYYDMQQNAIGALLAKPDVSQDDVRQSLAQLNANFNEHLTPDILKSQAVGLQGMPAGGPALREWLSVQNEKLMTAQERMDAARGQMLQVQSDTGTALINRNQYGQLSQYGFVPKGISPADAIRLQQAGVQIGQAQQGLQLQARGQALTAQAQRLEGATMQQVGKAANGAPIMAPKGSTAGGVGLPPLGTSLGMPKVGLPQGPAGAGMLTSIGGGVPGNGPQGGAAGPVVGALGAGAPTGMPSFQGAPSAPSAAPRVPVQAAALPPMGGGTTEQPTTRSVAPSAQAVLSSPPAAPTPASPGAAATSPPSSLPKGAYVGLSPEQEAQQKAVGEKLGSGAGDYVNSLNTSTGELGQLMKNFQELRPLMAEMRLGPGADTRTAMAGYVKSFGAPLVQAGVMSQKTLDRLSGEIQGGDNAHAYAAAQEFSKFAVQQAMITLRHSLMGAGGSRININEWMAFQKSNPNLDTDPEAVEKLFNFATQMYEQNRDEQSELSAYRQAGGDLTQWPNKWLGIAEKKGYIQPQILENYSKGTKETAAPQVGRPQAPQGGPAAAAALAQPGIAQGGVPKPVSAGDLAKMSPAQRKQVLDHLFGAQ